MSEQVEDEAVVDNPVALIVLTQQESEAYKQAKQVAHANLQAYIEAGVALAAIRDNRWYRADGFRTFEEFCQREFSISRPRAYEFINAAKVAADLSAIADKVPMPTNESQTRSLVQLDAADRPVAWSLANDKAKAEGAPVAARHVADAVQEVKAAKEPKPAPAPAATPLFAPLNVSVPTPSTFPGSGASTSGVSLLGSGVDLDIGAAVTLADITEPVFTWQGPIHRLRFHYRDGYGNDRTAFAEITQEGDGTQDAPFMYTAVLNGETLTPAGSLIKAKQGVEDKIMEGICSK